MSNPKATPSIRAGRKTRASSSKTAQQSSVQPLKAVKSTKAVNKKKAAIAETIEVINKARNFFVTQAVMNKFKTMPKPAKAEYDAKELGVQCEPCRLHGRDCKIAGIKVISGQHAEQPVLKLPTCKECRKGHNKCQPPVLFLQMPPTAGAMQKRGSRAREAESKAPKPAAAAGPAPKEDGVEVEAAESAPKPSPPPPTSASSASTSPSAAAAELDSTETASAAADAGSLQTAANFLLSFGDSFRERSQSASTTSSPSLPDTPSPVLPTRMLPRLIPVLPPPSVPSAPLPPRFAASFALLELRRPLIHNKDSGLSKFPSISSFDRSGLWPTSAMRSGWQL